MTTNSVGGESAGFIAIDGLVGLTLVAIVLGLVLSAIATSVQSVRAATERRQAAVEAEFRLLVGAMQTGESDTYPGRSKLQFTPSADFSGELCDVASVAQLGRRQLQLKTVVFCPTAAEKL